MSSDRYPAIVSFHFTCKHSAFNADAHHVNGVLVCARCNEPIRIAKREAK